MNKICIFLIALKLSLKLDLEIQPKKKNCINLEFSINDPVNFNTKLISGTDDENSYVHSIEDKFDNLLIKENENQHSISYNFKKSGTFLFCVKNKINKILRIEFEIKYGSYLGFNQNLADEKDTKNIKTQIDSLAKTHEKIYKQYNRIYNKTNYRRNANNKINKNYLFIGFLMIIVIIFISISQIFYLKNTVFSKKIN